MYLTVTSNSYSNKPILMYLVSVLKKKKGLLFGFFFYLINWSYFTMTLLYYDLILEA
jgi:hypothetical protein